MKAGTTPAAPSDLSLGVEAAEARFIRRFHDAGGVIVAGTDDIPFAPAGVSEELRLLVLAGLSPLAALQTSTVNAAQVLGWRDAGTIEVGKIADLVVLDADPLQDILNVRRIRADVLIGRLIDRAALDGFLATVGQR